MILNGVLGITFISLRSEAIFLPHDWSKASDEPTFVQQGNDTESGEKIKGGI